MGMYAPNTPPSSPTSDRSASLTLSSITEIPYHPSADTSMQTADSHTPGLSHNTSAASAGVSTRENPAATTALAISIGYPSTDAPAAPAPLEMIDSTGVSHSVLISIADLYSTILIDVESTLTLELDNAAWLTTWHDNTTETHTNDDMLQDINDLLALLKDHKDDNATIKDLYSIISRHFSKR